MTDAQSEIVWRLKLLAIALDNLTQNETIYESHVNIDRSALAQLFAEFRDGLEALERAA
jgi:hypothetical protein